MNPHMPSLDLYAHVDMSTIDRIQHMQIQLGFK